MPAFDDPDFDDVNHPTAQAGITCTGCHAITNINTPKGNSDYTIEEPLHYPFTYSGSEFLQWVNRALVKAKPDFHKRTFLKPLHKTPEFCGTCHKVHLPVELNAYKWLRGQNHYDSYHLSVDICHAITNINTPKGNSDYTIEEPLHYPFTYSGSEFLQWVNRALVKAKPDFHKRTFLKPLHKTPEFCGTCHKVHLPVELNAYKWLRGQNHYDSYHLSGVSGHGVTSFYYPPRAEHNCNGCHLPLHESDDFGTKANDDSGVLTVHDHQFPSASDASI